MSDAVEIAAGLLTQVSKILKSLKSVELSQLLDGSASIRFVPPGHRVTAPRTTNPPSAKGIDVDELAGTLRGLTSEQVVARLSNNRKITILVISELAKSLSITIPPVAKTRDRKIAVLAESLVGYRENAEAVMGGTYRA